MIFFGIITIKFSVILHVFSESFVLDFVRKTSRVHLHRMEVIFLDNVHWRNIMTEKLEKLKQGYTNLSEDVYKRQCRNFVITHLQQSEKERLSV